MKQKEINIPTTIKCRTIMLQLVRLTKDSGDERGRAGRGGEGRRQGDRERAKGSNKYEGRTLLKYWVHGELLACRGLYRGRETDANFLSRCGGWLHRAGSGMPRVCACLRGSQQAAGAKRCRSITCSTVPCEIYTFIRSIVAPKMSL